LAVGDFSILSSDESAQHIKELSPYTIRPLLVFANKQDLPHPASVAESKWCSSPPQQKFPFFPTNLTTTTSNPEACP